MSSAIEDPGDDGVADIRDVAAGLVSPATAAAADAAGTPTPGRWAGPLRTEDDFEKFFAEEWAKVLAFIRLRVPFWDDAMVQDVAQEAWSAVYNKVGQIREARAYLYKTVRRKIVDELRHRVDAAPDEDLDELIAAARAAAGAPDDPADLVAAREIAIKDVNPAAREVLQVLFELPERRCVAYSLRVGHGMSSAEIAQVLGCTPIAVDGLVHQARTTLRQRLGRDRVAWFEAGDWRWPE